MDDNNENTNESIDIDTPYTTIISQVESFTKQNICDHDGISTESIVVKIPVVLADINIMFNLETNIILDKLAREIKKIKKNVFLTQSSIIPFVEYNEPNSGILFVKGFIRNNIEYIPQKHSVPVNKNVYGNIRYCIVETPFEFNTKITFSREPVLNEKSTQNELEFCTYKLTDNDDDSDKVIECNFCDESSLFTEIFNEKPFTELIRVDIIEVDVNKNSIFKDITNTEESVTNLTEKSVVNLSLKVLQRQEIKISTL
ncbi:CsxC family protein [uncultured Clostridium sp.]|uniref:CsxC family protein n=1 Tax=uncultured Clostridium sp. TaxID=59620 RepID=UPI00258B0A86|nr:hypothetical protein [uncultured Clostridium sp.]